MRRTHKVIRQALFFSSSMVFWLTGFGQTTVPMGNVSGTWTKSGSPYVVNGNITIANNQKLTIQPGVEVRFSGSYSFSVQGCLDARGVEGDSIRFTVSDKSGFSTNTHLGWKGIRFQNVVHTDSSAIDYCILEYGKATGNSGENSGGAVFINGFGRIKIRNTVLQNNRSVYGGAIAARQVTNLVLKDLTLRGNYAAETGGGIYAQTSVLTLTRCRVLNNTAAYGGGGIYIGNSSTVYIDKSVVVGNKGGAIESFWLSNVNIDHSTVAGNTGSPDGLDLYLSSLTCRNSILWNKTSNNTFPEIHAVDQSKVTLDYCIVKGAIESGWKVSNTSTADPKFVDLAKLNANLGWTGYPLKDVTKSSAIDAGDPTGTHDPDGTIADIGALPFTQTAVAFPTVRFAADTTLGLIPLAITFSNYSTQAQGEIASWKWSFGDNINSTEKNPTHQYTSAGTYDVKLVATNQQGKKDSLTLVKYVRALAGTVVNSPTVEGTWTRQSSPYNIFNTITVAEGKTLAIEPGVQVIFFGPYSINVKGNLSARGTAADSIVFDRFDEKSSWHSIRVENVAQDSDSTIFEYCRIAHTEYTGGDVTKNGGNAVLVKNFDKVRISHCLIRNNKGGRGAGIYAEDADIKINDNVIRNNSVAQYGAGIYVEGGSPLISGNRIERNYGGSAAGGIWLSASKSKIENNLISYNHSYWSGAGMVINNNSDCIIHRNLISYNESDHDNGGGLSISGSSPRIVNSTIAFNKAEVGEGVLISGSSGPDFINTLIYGNRDRYQNANSKDEIYISSSNARPNFYNCNLQAGISGIGMQAGVYSGIAEGNIDARPLFKDSVANDLSPTWNSYPLANSAKSPCIDGGMLESPHDPDGSRADIGAFYFHQADGSFPPRVNFEADTLLGFNSLVVAFRDLSDPGNSGITEWHWAFGDGSTSTERHPIHEYATEGRFDVTLTINDENGFERKITRENYVRLIAGVYVKGKVEGIFDAPRYLVGGDLFVDEAKTLEVRPGAEFVFLGDFKLDVRGALKAIGTAINPIVFTSYDTTGLDLAHATGSFTHNPGGWGGIYVYASGAQDSTVIDYCKIQFVENNGLGAIYAFSQNGAAGMRISNSEISYNSTQGIHFFATNLIIRNNYIHHNYSSYQNGAGIYCRAGSPRIVNNIIANNETASDGGGLCISTDSRPKLIGNAITHNKASRAGGICDYEGWIELINNTIAYNTSTNSSGGGYYVLYAGDVKFTNNIIFNNTPKQVEVADGYTKIGFKNCILQGGSTGITAYANSVSLFENVLTEDPKLIAGKNGYGRLLPGSPALNAGTTVGIETLLPALDLVKNTRITNSQIDIGAYEYVSEPVLSVVSPLADVNTEEDFDPFAVSLKSLFGFEYGSKFLVYNADNTAGDKLFSVAIRDQDLYFTPMSDKFGEQTVTVTASSGANQITSSFVVRIAPVDDAPQFTVAGDLFVEEDFAGSKPYQITIYTPFGEENQSRAFTLEPPGVDFASIQFNATTGMLAFSANPNLFGSQRFTLTMTEAQQAHSESFTFSVGAVNDPPVITVDNSLITIKEKEEKILPVIVSDVENDIVALTLSATDNSISLSTTNTSTNEYNLIVSGQAVGQSSINLSASDGKLVTTETIPVTVTVVVGLCEGMAYFDAYPNPTMDYIVVRVKSKSSAVLYNSSGQEVLREMTAGADLMLSVGHLVPGVYLLQVDDGNLLRVFRVVKQ